MEFQGLRTEKTLMAEVWFTCVGNLVRGPFTTVEVQFQVARGYLSLGDMIWRRGLKEWLTVGRWSETQHEFTPPVAETNLRVWYMRSNGAHIGPFSEEELVRQLKGVRAPDSIWIWNPSLPEWKGLAEFPSFLEKIGIPVRKTPRIPVSGEVLLNLGGRTLKGQLQVLGTGGLGVLMNQALAPGAEAQVTIESEASPLPVRAQGRILYSAQDGITGMAFTQVSSEANSLLHDMVRQVTKKAA